LTALLAFDTSTEQMSVGLLAGGRTWEHDAAGGASASARLLPIIAGLLQRAGISLENIDAIGFGQGPGAFTGLRTACSVAQGLALGARKPLLAIDTLMAVAEDARPAAEAVDVWVAMDARMGQIYAARYRYVDHHWAAVEVPVLTSPDALNAAWLAQPPQHVAGTALSAFAGRLQTGDSACQVDALPRAAALLRLAASQWVQGRTLDAAAALPVYLRDKVAQTMEERAATRRLASGAVA
jgi:tRNA threonylcarbamoyladenosine biosynthesis protein TsaB